eukprot:TRINITY_DN9100_c0_g1_i4.p1 TRINITY_DN9100_c0_g1~~TRINITY_DN9100_c0_g1_i4.p1  ORF type:complete len:125 (+),score=18.28 TRINITY_DN9100_c0_g1_i4:52-426(+)
MPMNRTLAICSGVVVGIAGLVMLTGISNPKQVIPTTNRPSGSEFFTSRASGVKIFTRKWIVSEAKSSIFPLVQTFHQHLSEFLIQVYLIEGVIRNNKNYNHRLIESLIERQSFVCHFVNKSLNP